MEKPVSRPMVPPIKPNWASIVTFEYFTKQHDALLDGQWDLFIPLNLIVCCRVKEDVHIFQGGMIQNGGWQQLQNHHQTNTYLDFLPPKGWRIHASHIPSYICGKRWSKSPFHHLSPLLMSRETSAEEQHLDGWSILIPSRTWLPESLMSISREC